MLRSNVLGQGQQNITCGPNPNLSELGKQGLLAHGHVLLLMHGKAVSATLAQASVHERASGPGSLKYLLSGSRQKMFATSALDDLFVGKYLLFRF